MTDERKNEDGKRILHFMGTRDVGGVERVTAKLANEWVRRSWKAASAAADTHRLTRTEPRSKNRSRNNGSGRWPIASSGDSRHPTAAFRMKNGLIGLLPYGLVIWVRCRFLHKQEVIPPFHYMGVWMLIRRIVRFCLPYFLMRPEPFKPVRFPSQAVSVARQLSDAVPNGRTVVFALFSRDGRIRETTRYYINKLGDVADNVVVFGDCPIIPDEVSKLPSVVRYCSFERHGEYDFGSYKRGYEYVMRHPVLSTSLELLLCNDSCYGPVTPFANVFAEMTAVNCDFWGLSENRYGQRHLQSYFLLFKRRVFLSPCFAAFMRGVQKEESVSAVIIKYEMRLTHVLEEHGFVGKSAFVLDGQERTLMDPTFHPISLMRRGCPLVKVKVIEEERGENNKEGVEETLSCVRMFNKDLYRLICDELSPRSASNKTPLRSF